MSLCAHFLYLLTLSYIVTTLCCCITSQPFVYEYSCLSHCCSLKKKNFSFEMPWYTRLLLFLRRCFNPGPFLVSRLVGTFHCLLHGFMLFVNVYTASPVRNVPQIPQRNKFIRRKCCYSWRKQISPGCLFLLAIPRLLITQARYMLGLFMPI